MSAPQSYYVPVDAGEAEFTEKRSRFLGHVRRVETEAEARAIEKGLAENSLYLDFDGSAYQIPADVMEKYNAAVAAIKDGKKKVVPRKVFPGYVLVDMIVDEHSWYVVRNTTGVTGFVGSEKHPIPLTDAEAKRILKSMGEEQEHKPELDVAVGDVVRINSGVFENYTGTVSESDTEKARLKVIVEETPIELGFDQVETL